MGSWVSIFAQLTPEALLFEALLICFLCAAYTAFWILRKRRYGSVKDSVPSGIVRNYLNHLIAEAEELKAQLFGLRSKQDKAPPIHTFTESPTEKAVSTTAEKTTTTPEPPPKEASETTTQVIVTDPSTVPMVQKLRDRVQILEDRLAEYSVIEDDLANLKRLQQENVQLKSIMTSKGIEIPKKEAEQPPAKPPATEAAPEAPAPQQPQATVTPATVTPVLEAATTAGSFDKLIDQVEKTLNSPPPPAEANTSPAPTPSASEKSDHDLVSEFEKMLEK